MAAKRIASFSQVDGLRRGTTVNVTFLVGSKIDDTISLCQSLQEAGMSAVAHLPARAFESLEGVEEYLVRLRDVGVCEVLVLGGGADRPAGSLHEAMQVLESGLLQRYNFSRVGVAAHPEGHPTVACDVMEEALLRKAEWAQANGMELYYETQFCFEAEPLVLWERRVRGLLAGRLGAGAKLPSVRLGVAGPAKISTLVKFAAMSGVGPSVWFVNRYAKNVLKLATTSAPDEVILGVAAHRSEEPGCLFQGLHFYTFGGLAPTVKWANSVDAGDFELSGMGFLVA